MEPIVSAFKNLLKSVGCLNQDHFQTADPCCLHVAILVSQCNYIVAPIKGYTE